MISATSPPRITVLGSLNVDLVSYVSEHPQPGETITSNQFCVSFGGKGANQAVACAKLSRTSNLNSASADVSMFGAVGSDAYGSEMRQALASYGVNIDGVRTVENGKTGIAMIVVEESTGQNRIILSPEANKCVAAEDYKSLPGPIPDLLVMQLEVPIETVLQALSTAKEARVPALLNPAPAQVLPDSAYAGLAHLVMNETEALLLSGLEESYLQNTHGLQHLASFFINKGVQHVVITLGDRGVYFATKSHQSGLVAAEKVDVVDTTAAGDTFIGSYALAVVESSGCDFDIGATVRKANRAAAITVSRRGAQASIPWRDEIK